MPASLLLRGLGFEGKRCAECPFRAVNWNMGEPEGWVCTMPTFRDRSGIVDGSDDDGLYYEVTDGNRCQPCLDAERAAGALSDRVAVLENCALSAGTALTQVAKMKP